MMLFDVSCREMFLISLAVGAVVPVVTVGCYFVCLFVESIRQETQTDFAQGYMDIIREVFGNGSYGRPGEYSRSYTYWTDGIEMLVVGLSILLFVITLSIIGLPTFTAYVALFIFSAWGIRKILVTNILFNEHVKDKTIHKKGKK